MKHPIGQTRNGVAVCVDLIGSNAAKLIAQQPYLLGLIQEVLRQRALHGQNVQFEHDLGRNIGYSFVVATTEKDTVFYAQLLRDSLYTRFVKNGKPLSTQHLTLVLERNDDKTYELRDVIIGRLTPPRPGSSDETEDSKHYWANHAYVLDNQSLQMRTVTKVCPY